MCTECPSELARDREAAFPRFVAHHQDLVYGVALRLAREPADAQDLAQETFLRAWRAIRRYDAARVAALRPRGWLARICLNLARNRARDERMATVPLEGANGPTSALPVDAPAGRPDALAERRESAREWRRRLDALPSRYGMAVELRHVHLLSYPELAEALGRPVGTVKSDVHRGVLLLREALAQEIGEELTEVAR